MVMLSGAVVEVAVAALRVLLYVTVVPVAAVSRSRPDTLALLAGRRIAMRAVLVMVVLIISRAALAIEMGIRRRQRDRSARTSQQDYGRGRGDDARPDQARRPLMAGCLRQHPLLETVELRW